MIEASTLKFLKELESNNNRDWFQSNKKAFEAAQDNVAALAGFLIGAVGKFDPSVAGLDPKSCVFRIYRDIRFSKDKSPYKTNLGSLRQPRGPKIDAARLLRSHSTGPMFRRRRKAYAQRCRVTENSHGDQHEPERVLGDRPKTRIS